ncbi:hypothetical protein VJI72_08180, partial [Parvimonas micra]|uniref:hypothetical protein n=1 Tax=Parvimonas micra TaxID=33033 RepID=UPI002B47A3BD
ITIAILIIPVLISLFIKPSLQEENIKYNLVIVQPNVDPYGKFNAGSTHEQISSLLQLTEQAIDSNTALVIWPETAMSAAEWQDNVLYSSYY